MTDSARMAAADAALLGSASIIVNTLFGVELQTLACAFVGAWIGAPLAKRLEAPGDATAQLSFSDKTIRAVKALLSYVAAAIASAVFATVVAGDPATPATLGLRNAMSVGIGIGFYVLVAKFMDDPVGAILRLFERVLPRRPPPPGGPS